MKSLDSNQPISAGEQKIKEYVRRIKNGESKDSIFQDLPESFRVGIEKGLTEPVEKIGEKVQESVSEIPPQYEGLTSEALNIIWTFPEYIDEEKTRELKAKKARVLASLQKKEAQEIAKEKRQKAEQERIEELRQSMGATPSEKVEKKETSVPDTGKTPLLSIEERKKLYGWGASYELAKIAKQQGVDLSQISREDYVNFAIQNSLAIDDDQLRAAPWQRMGTSVQEIVLANRQKKAEIKDESEKAFARFHFDIKKKAGEQNRILQDGIKIRQGTQSSDSWLFFGINKSLEENPKETHKAYISVKDLNTLTPQRFIQFMTALRDAKYNGDVKIFQDLTEMGVNLNDQIVMHGRSKDDAELAMQVAERFFGADLDQKSVGKDEVVDGENKSYSQILAKKIKDTVKPNIDKILRS